MKIYKVISECTSNGAVRTFVQDIFLDKKKAEEYLSKEFKSDLPYAIELEKKEWFFRAKLKTQSIFMYIKECDLNDTTDFENLIILDTGQIYTDTEIFEKALEERILSYREYINDADYPHEIIDKEIATKIANLIKGE